MSHQARRRTATRSSGPASRAQYYVAVTHCAVDGRDRTRCHYCPMRELADLATPASHPRRTGSAMRRRAVTARRLRAATATTAKAATRTSGSADGRAKVFSANATEEPAAADATALVLLRVYVSGNSAIWTILP